MVLLQQFLSCLRAENLRGEVADDTGNAKRNADKTIYALAATVGTKTCVLRREGVGGWGATAAAAPSPMYISFYFVRSRLLRVLIQCIVPELVKVLKNRIT